MSASSSATITANGNPLEIKLPCRLSDFLSQSGWKPTQVVVELNGQVIPRTRIGDIELKDADQLEVIVPVAGG